MREKLGALVALIALFAALPATAQAATKHHLTGHRAIAVARHDPKVRAELRRYPAASPRADFKKGSWEATWSLRGDALVRAFVNDRTGKVDASYTGYQVEWMMARGTPGLFGHKLNSAVVWIPMCLVFFAGLFDRRRPWRMVHLDLLVLLSFSVSQLFFNRGEIGLSVPLAYPVLLYLLGRCLWVGFRGAGGGIRPSFPVKWLAIATLFLLAFRVGLNVQDSAVIDVGYSGVIGADKVAHGHAIYGDFPADNRSGDTYAPAAYYAYVPFELAWPWHGHWDDLPAAHAAAVFFDLLTVALLFLLGRRLRRGRAGRDLGVTLAFAWAAFPYTDYALQSNSNDAMVAAAVVGILLVSARPLARGGAVALAAATKFAPLVLAPLFAEPRPLRWRRLALYAAGMAVVGGLLMAQTIVDPGLGKFYERTLRFQSDRGSPFSIWGQDPSLETVQTVIKAAVVLLALGVAFAPRPRSLARTAALAAALVIGAQLTVEHWFYLYIPWFFPLLMVGLAADRLDEPDAEPEMRVIRAREPAEGPALSSPPVPVS